MSEFSFAPEVAEEAQAENQHENRAGDPGTLALSADEFSALEDRILRAVNLVKRERMARAAAEDRAALAETRAGESSAHAEQVEKELQALRAERDQVKQRVERLLSQLDALEL